MKIDIFNPSTQEVIETYSVPELSILDFQQWKDKSDIVICLSRLLDVVSNLDSKDSETNEPISGPKRVDFYIPNPIRDHVISKFTKFRKDTGRNSDHILDEENERVIMSELKSSTILASVAKEILQNHQERSDYKVKITDG